MTQRGIIVIGAGIAGCAAARALVDAGHDVIVVEARDRVGGRMHSVDGFDYGAHWIHGTEGNPLTTLARQFSLPLLFVGGDSSYIGGWDRLDFPRANAVDKDHSIITADRMCDAVDDVRAGMTTDISYADAADRALATLGVDARTAALARWHVDLVARDDCAADPSGFSSKNWDDGYEVHGYGDSVLPGGTQALVDRLADGLDIRLNMPVTQISYAADGVTVTTAQGSMAAERVVITLPLGVLKSDDVQFDPPLPPAKRAAIARLGFGTLAKVRVHFAAPFWPRHVYAFGLLAPPGHAAPTVAVNELLMGDVPALIMPIGGADGIAVERMSAAQRRTWVLAILRYNFGDMVPVPDAIDVTSWADDRYARGTYSHVATGGSARDFALLAAPVADRLWFAGEATSPNQWATMHGAYVSGLQAAADITGDKSLLPPLHFTENRRWRSMMTRANRFLALRRADIGAEDITARVELLSACTVFAQVEWTELAMLATMLEPRDLAAGETLCRYGDPADEIYLLATGALDVVGGDGAVLTRMGAGQLAGEYGMFGNSRRMAGLVASAPTHLLTLDYTRFRRFLLAFPQTALDLLGAGVGRLLKD